MFLNFFRVKFLKKARYSEFESYKDLQSLSYDELKLAVNYICSNLNSPSYNYHYWYDMYCYTSKSLMVMEWLKQRGFKEHARLGEAVCDGVITNFLKEKEHFKCSCSSVCYNAVF